MGFDLCEFIHEFSEYILNMFCVPDLMLGSEDKVVNKVNRPFWNRIDDWETNN